MNNLLETALPGHAPPGTRLYAIGDVHGQLPLLEELHEAIRRDLREAEAARIVAIYLGDYVDRGRDSRAVIDLLASETSALGDRVETVHLAGNHEDMMLTALDAAQAGTGHGAGMTMSWLQNGGVETLASYGVSVDTSAPFTELAESVRRGMDAEMPPRHRAFLDGLKPHHRGGWLPVRSRRNPARHRTGAAIPRRSAVDPQGIPGVPRPAPVRGGARTYAEPPAGDAGQPPGDRHWRVRHRPADLRRARGRRPTPADGQRAAGLIGSRPKCRETPAHCAVKAVGRRQTDRRP